MAYVVKSELPIRVTVDADTPYVSICWVGASTSGGCFCDDEQVYCESVYIGVNSSCSSNRSVNGSVTWNGITIPYQVTQLPKTCDGCDKTKPSCELISMTASPYYVPYKQSSTSKIFYEYWDYSLDNSNCEITRNRKSGTTSVSFTQGETDIPCSGSSRTINKSVNIGCIGNQNIGFYVKMPDMCCDYPSGICYDIGDVYYVNSGNTLIDSVYPSGETINFYFDYKKVETDDKCNSRITYGRYFSEPWVIEGCHDTECCKDTEILFNDGGEFVWNDHKSCDGSGNDITIPISITRRKDYTYSGDCSEQCEAMIGYCVDKNTIKKYYKNTNGEWDEIIGNSYTFPNYGGEMRVTWDYSATTIYEDCTSATTSGNTWEDILDIPPYEVTDDMPCGNDTSAFTIHYEFKTKLNDSSCENEFDVEYEQQKLPCEEECKTCLTKTNITLDSGGTETVSDTATCNVISFENNTEWINVNLNGNNITYSASPNDSSIREGKVRFKVSGATDCYNDVIVTQNGVDTPKSCRITGPTSTPTSSGGTITLTVEEL